MSHITRIGIDTSKAVFTLHCATTPAELCCKPISAAHRWWFSSKSFPHRDRYGSMRQSHHWGRELSALGHDVRLIPPHMSSPSSNAPRNDRNDAEAICEAGGRPGMRFVPVKSAEQQAQAMVLKVRETLIDQHTQLANSLRGHAAEFGVIAGKGIKRIPPLLEATKPTPPFLPRQGKCWRCSDGRPSISTPDWLNST